jgi:hypothetical protein
MANGSRLMVVSTTSWSFMAGDMTTCDCHLGVPHDPYHHQPGALDDQPPAPPLWRDRLFWLTLALTIFALAPFMLPGYFWSANDARHHVYFLFEYDRLVQDGIWWPRWSPDFAFGYGYPFFNIYGPFSHFLAELFLHFLGFSYTGAVEMVFCVSILGSATAMYLFMRSWHGPAAALVAALVYVYIPYHLLNLYIRANLAESMAFVWLPLCLWTVRQAVIQPSWPWVAGAAISYAGLMFTSNLVISLFTGPLGIYLLVLVLVYGAAKRQNGGPLSWSSMLWSWVRTALPPGLGLIAGLGLSAVFWLPALLEYRYVRVDQWFAGRYDFRGDFIYFYQLFSPSWGFGASQVGPDDAFSFQLGATPWICATLGPVCAWPYMQRDRWETGFFVIAGIVTTVIGLQIAAPLWDLPIIGGILQIAQFPWRWFSITALCLSVLAGLVAHPLLLGSAGAYGRQLNLPLFCLLTVVLLSSYPYLQVEIREPAEGPVNLASLMRFQQSSDEMTGSTAWVKEIPTWSPHADVYINQEAQGQPVEPVSTLVDYGNTTWPIDYENFGVRSEAHNSVMEEVYFDNRRTTEQRIVFNHFYYPGWRAYLLDGLHGQPVRELPVIPEETGTLGRMTVPVPPGEGYVLLRYEDTPPRTIGKAVSLATLAGLIIIAVMSLFRTRLRSQT